MDELALPKQGTKLDKWTRLEKRERELIRERKSPAAIDAGREAGPEGRRREAAIPISDPRDPSTTENELTHLPPRPWCEQYGESSQAGDVRTCGIYTPCHCIRFLCYQDLWNRPRCDRRRRSDVLGVARREHRVHEGRAGRWKDSDRLPGRRWETLRWEVL